MLIIEQKPIVQWDDIPESIQRQIYQLEGDLEEWETLHEDDPNREQKIISIKRKINKLEKPYTIME